MKHPVTRELYEYWDRLRAGRAAPERADVDPAMIRAILADTFILEADAESSHPQMPFRLSGTRLNALLMAELKGRSLLALFEGADREAMLDHRLPAVAGLRAAPRHHRPIDLELILLPLRHQAKTHVRLLGAAAPFVVPPWLGLIPVERLSLASLRFVEVAPAWCGEPAHGEQASTVRPPAQPKRYGSLVVHQGGR